MDRNGEELKCGRIVSLHFETFPRFFRRFKRFRLFFSLSPPLDSLNEIEIFRRDRWLNLCEIEGQLV